MLYFKTKISYFGRKKIKKYTFLSVDERILKKMSKIYLQCRNLMLIYSCIQKRMLLIPYWVYESIPWIHYSQIPFKKCRLPGRHFCFVFWRIFSPFYFFFLCDLGTIKSPRMNRGFLSIIQSNLVFNNPCTDNHQHCQYNNRNQSQNWLCIHRLTVELWNLLFAYK